MIVTFSSCLITAQAKDKIRPSFQLISPSEQTLYNNLQQHGFCTRVLKIERKVLIKANVAEIKSRALGYRRCLALRDLAVALAIPKLKGGDKLYAAYSPKPRLGNFQDLTSKERRELLQTQRTNQVGKRPMNWQMDWQEDPLSLKIEIRLHQAYTDLVKLGYCHHMPQALHDLGQFYDQLFALGEPYLLYGLFAKASRLNIDKAAMQRRLNRIDDAFSPFERVRLHNHVQDNTLSHIPELRPLIALCE